MHDTLWKTLVYKAKRKRWYRCFGCNEEEQRQLRPRGWMVVERNRGLGWHYCGKCAIFQEDFVIQHIFGSVSLPRCTIKLWYYILRMMHHIPRITHPRIIDNLPPLKWGWCSNMLGYYANMLGCYATTFQAIWLFAMQRLDMRCARTTDGSWARIATESIRRLNHHHGSPQEKVLISQGIQSTLEGTGRLRTGIKPHTRTHQLHGAVLVSLPPRRMGQRQHLWSLAIQVTEYTYSGP